MLLLSISSVLGLTSGPISALIGRYGYLAVFILVGLEAASLPIGPNEIVLPLVGYLAAIGKMNILYAFVIVIVAQIVGMAVNYYIAYFLGKDVIYKHLGLFHIKRKSLEEFDLWFAKNGDFTVFITRLLPVVRGLVNFPAGFAKMDIKRFFFYSIAGSLIWDVLLMGFGYYALSVGSLSVLLALVAVFAIVLYLVYRLAMDRISGKGRALR